MTATILDDEGNPIENTGAITFPNMAVEQISIAMFNTISAECLEKLEKATTAKEFSDAVITAMCIATQKGVEIGISLGSGGHLSCEFTEDEAQVEVVSSEQTTH